MARGRRGEVIPDPPIVHRMLPPDRELVLERREDRRARRRARRPRTRVRGRLVRMQPARWPIDK